MRQRILSIVAMILLSGFVIPRPLVWGFTVATHTRISNAAANQSDLEEHLPTLGLNAIDDTVVFLPATGSEKSAREWLQLGSEYEDDLFEPFSLSLRFRNHFYNPRNGSGLAFSPAFPCSVGGTQSGKPAPDWGLDEGGVNQEYSLKDARDAYHKGLTAPFKDFRDTQQPPEDTRSHYLARMFETLGHVIHLIQDMAQPQHTRNDPHGPWCFGTGSFYEGHTEETLTDPMLTGYQPVYGSTDTNTFNAPRKFWHGEGKGLAEYTNRGFVTTGTNFDTFLSGNFPEPDLNLATSQDEDMSALCKKIGLPTPPGPNGPSPCIMRFVKTRVTDAYRPGTAAEEENARASTYSIFSADLKTYNEQVAYTDPTTGQVFMTPVLYTLNSLNFDARNEFVIKRAVGYSAGFINYFFRGKIDLVPDPQNVTRVLILNQGDEDMKGTFTLYYDDEQEVRRPVTSWTTGEFALDGTLAAQTNMSVPRFEIPNTPPPANSSGFTLVFAGEMGAEQPVPPNLPNPSPGAVVAKQIFCSPVFITAGGRLSNAGNGWLFQPDSSVQAGNVDWVWANGCQRFSWQGPFGRYLHLRHTSELSDKIFSGGNVVATAPGPVLGVGVQSDAADPSKHLLIAVVAEIDAFDRIIKDKVYATRLEDPTAWEFLGEFGDYSFADQSTQPHKTKHPSHYYFNASGTQAVSVKRTANAQDSLPAEQNPWRTVLLNVSVGLESNSIGGQASFDLSPVEALDTGATNLPGGRTEVSFTAHSVAADFLGDQLVKLHLEVEEVYEYSRSETRIVPVRTYITSSSDTRMITLRTNLGWDWDLINEVGTSSSQTEASTSEEVTFFQRAESEGIATIRGVEYLDLRFLPPVVAYEEHEITGDSFYLEQNEVVLQDDSNFQDQERLVWNISNKVHEVRGWRDIDITDEPGEFALSRYSFWDRLWSWGPDIEDVVPDGETIGTFAVGGPPSAPQVIGAHKNPRIERNFMFPEGDLSAFGGGPVGF